MRIALAVLLACCAPCALADVVQFEIGKGGAYATYASVRAFDAANRQVFSGSSDGYGRVTIAIPPGRYTVRVKTRSGEKSAAVDIKGDRALRMVTLPP
ncbi:MAG: hypothetical protein U1F15_06205 [Burkholderiales bacterium]